MPINIPFAKKPMTMAELEEENEALKVQAENEQLKLTIAQQQALRKRLESQGLTVKRDFGGSIKKAWQWFQTH